MLHSASINVSFDTDEQVWAAIHEKALDKGFSYKSLHKDDWDTVWPTESGTSYERTYSRLVDGRWQFLVVTAHNSKRVQLVA